MTLKLDKFIFHFNLKYLFLCESFLGSCHVFLIFWFVFRSETFSNLCKVCYLIITSIAPLAWLSKWNPVTR